MTKELSIRNSTAEFLIFTAQAGKDLIEVSMRMRPFGSPKK